MEPLQNKADSEEEEERDTDGCGLQVSLQVLFTKREIQSEIHSLGVCAGGSCLACDGSRKSCKKRLTHRTPVWPVFRRITSRCTTLV